MRDRGGEIAKVGVTLCSASEIELRTKKWIRANSHHPVRTRGFSLIFFVCELTRRRVRLHPGIENCGRIEPRVLPPVEWIEWLERAHCSRIERWIFAGFRAANSYSVPSLRGAHRWHPEACALKDARRTSALHVGTAG